MTIHYIPAPDKTIFEHEGMGSDTKVVSDSKGTYIIEKIDFDGDGIFIHYRGSTYPRKGFPTPEGVVAINRAKRFIITFLRLKPLCFSLDKILLNLEQLCYNDLRPHFLKYSKMTPFAQGIQDITYQFLRNLGLGEWRCKTTAQILATIMEYDCAYRFRIEDICSETDVEKLTKNPFKEVGRIGNIAIKRESDVRVREGMQNMMWLRWLFLIPRFKKAFKDSISSWHKLQYDEADRYWVSLRDETYQYMGQSNELRNSSVKHPDIVHFSIEAM